MQPIALATEDELSEAIGLRLIAEHQFLCPTLQLRKDGFGYLRSSMPKWAEMAQRQVMFVLTDLDRLPCPLALLDDWFRSTQRPEHLIFRIAVRTIESWVLADHQAMGRLFGKKVKLPPDPDTLPEPKSHLLTLARKAPRDVRDDLLAVKGAIASQGLGYNRRLVDLVQNEWDPARASERSPSLRRARASLAALRSV